MKTVLGTWGPSAVISDARTAAIVISIGDTRGRIQEHVEQESPLVDPGRRTTGRDPLTPQKTFTP